MPGNDPPEPERRPVYFADLAAFAAYYRLTESVARRTVARMVVLGYLEPACYWVEDADGQLVNAGPAPGWEVAYDLPPPLPRPLPPPEW